MSEEKVRRFRISENTPRTPITDPSNPNGNLGYFIPGGEYRFTPQNSAQVECLIADGLAVEIFEPTKGERGLLEFQAKPGKVTGTGIVG